MTRSLFNPDGPCVYSLPPAAGFAASLIQVLTEAFPDPDALSALTLLVPTRRAGRVLAEAFTHFSPSGSGVALLPAIRPIGDVDADDPPFEPGELADIAPPSVSIARRRFELARLILARESAVGRSMGPGGALALADDLAGLIDDLATEGVDDLSHLDDTIRGHLPAHMQEAALFLDIVLDAWPARLNELGLIDPARRRTLLLNALADRWTTQPPEAPVIAAGSTGSIPAAANLLTTVANLEHGLVVLPGLQTDMDDKAWAQIDDGHPQRAMKALLHKMGLAHDQIPTLPGSENGRAETARSRIITEAMRPAEATSDWVQRVKALKSDWGQDVFHVGLGGLSILEADSPADESRAIALMLKETLSQPDQTAIVVTPDRSLARRISTQMSRFGVKLDDSAGDVLSDTPPCQFLIRLMDLVLDPGSALSLTSLWASPLFSLGQDRGPLHGRLGELERTTLRGQRPGHSLSDVAARIEMLPDQFDRHKSKWLAVIEQLDRAVAPLLDLDTQASLRNWTIALCRAAETLAGDETLTGEVRLWTGDAGDSTAQLMSDFLHESEALPNLSAEDMRQVLLEMARSRKVRAQFGGHPRLQLLGPLEARLVQADRVILAGLNEGVWPAPAKIDPFLSRGMREAAGLSMPEQRFGLSAHDFAQLTAGRDVIMTRSIKAGGAPTVASRWLWRLQTLTQGALGPEAEANLKPGLDYTTIARQIDHPDQRTRIDPPDAKPPVKDRPRQLSVTQIEKLVRDPYAIYARHILGLKKLDPLDAPSGARERGIAYHQAIEDWIESMPPDEGLPEEAEEHLAAFGQTALAKAGFTTAELAEEIPRFKRLAAWLTQWETKRRSWDYTPAAMEISGSLSLDGPAGAFTVTARADRIDTDPDGHFHVLDYKTGRTPTAKEVAAGYAPQLPLEAAMIASGGFNDLKAGEPGDLTYIRISGGKKVGETRHLTGKQSGMDMAERAVDRLATWIAWFDDPKNGYRSQISPQFSHDWGDYDQLARRKEWDEAPEGGDRS